MVTNESVGELLPPPQVLNKNVAGVRRGENSKFQPGSLDTAGKRETPTIIYHTKLPSWDVPNKQMRTRELMGQDSLSLESFPSETHIDRV